jgi:uncharacterized protein
MAGSPGGHAEGSALTPVPIQDLRALAEGRAWTVEQHLEGLTTLTPVRGQVRAVHRGTVLEVEGEAETIVTLCCDRCLQHYNHPLSFSTREFLWMRRPGADPDAPAALEAATALPDLDPSSLSLHGVPGDGGDGDLGEDIGDEIDPGGSFDPAQWTFEQLSLRLPLVNRCGPDCPGPATWVSSDAAGDPRWAALAALRRGGERTDER